MNRRHEAFFDAESIVEDFSDRSEAVRRARCVGNDLLAFVCIGVNAANEHVCLTAVSTLFGRSGEYNVFCTSCEVFFSEVHGEETACRFNDIFSTDFVPFEVGRIHFSRYADFFAVNDELAVFDVSFDRAVELAVHGVVFEHVCHVVNRAEVVDAYDFDVITSLCSAENKTTNTTETINTNFNHCRYTPFENKITFLHNSKNLRALLLTL